MIADRSDRVNASTAGMGRDRYLAQWSRRFLIVSVLGIAALTLFPFRFDFSRIPPSNASPFLLGPFHKSAGFLDFFLNVLLFLPFGFALTNLCRLRGRSWTSTFGIVYGGGALCSYLVEFLQIYVPGRSSGWEDILSNSTGAVVGLCVFAGWNRTLLRNLSHCERAMEAWLTPTRAALILIGYLGFVFGASVPLQQKTSLSNWAPDCYLLVGGDGSGQHLWNGKIFSLQLWDHPLAGIRARSLTADRLPAENDPYLLVSYDFANVPPFKDEKRFLPALIRVRHTPALGNSTSFDPIVNFWLASKEPIPNLIRTLQKTNQFALRVVCEPAQVAGANGHIISIGDEAHILNLRLRQEGDALVIWLRTPLSMGPGNLVWMVPHVFVVNHVQKILLSYDGSYGSLYVNGHMASRPYRLNPGAGLAQMFGGIGTESLDGYSIVYDGIVFAPIGLLLGMAARKRNEQGISDWLLLAAGLIAPAILFEWFLDHLSGRTGSVAQAGLCACMSLLGWMWINADRPARRNPGG